MHNTVRVLNATESFSLKWLIGGLSWWLSGKESDCQCRRHGFDPWSRKIPHASEQLSSCLTTSEPVLGSPGTATTEARSPQSLCSTTRKATARGSPCTAMSSSRFLRLEKALMQQQRPRTVKNKYRNKTNLKKYIDPFYRWRN